MTERVYQEGAPFAHLIRQFSDTKALCGRTAFPDWWRGQTLMEERQRARTLPLCATCRTRALGGL